MRSGTVGSEAQRRIVREQCDYLIEPPMPDIGLRDWKKFDRAIQEGYDTARACIEKNGVPLTHVTSMGGATAVPRDRGDLDRGVGVGRAIRRQRLVLEQVIAPPVRPGENGAVQFGAFEAGVMLVTARRPSPLGPSNVTS